MNWLQRPIILPPMRLPIPMPGKPGSRLLCICGHDKIHAFRHKHSYYAGVALMLILTPVFTYFDLRFGIGWLLFVGAIFGIAAISYNAKGHKPRCSYRLGFIATMRIISLYYHHWLD